MPKKYMMDMTLEVYEKEYKQKRPSEARVKKIGLTWNDYLALERDERAINGCDYDYETLLFGPVIA